MDEIKKFKLAAIQAESIPFDKEASLDKACKLIIEAGAQGADLAAFGECWLPCFPFFVNAEPKLWDIMGADYLANSIEIPGAETERLCAAAKEGGIDVAIGVLERDSNSKSSVYCTLLFIGSEGQILGRHRKMKPTFTERAVWADGDAVGLRTYQRPYGRISGLNCWEHKMILPSYALAAEGTEIHIAAWPGREVPAPAAPSNLRMHLLSRAFATQAGAYVVAVGGMRTYANTPERFKEVLKFEHTGDSVIIDPRGEIIAGPAQGETILFAEGTRESIQAAKMWCDVGSSYSRPDLMRLSVNREVQTRVLRHDSVHSFGTSAQQEWEQ